LPDVSRYLDEHIDVIVSAARILGSPAALAREPTTAEKPGLVLHFTKVL
jgi:hypothetical protein